VRGGEPVGCWRDTNRSPALRTPIAGGRKQQHNQFIDRNFDYSTDWMKYPSSVNTQLHRVPAILMLIFFQAVGSACRDNNVTRVRLKLEDGPTEKRMAVKSPAPVPLVCPTAGIAPLARSQPGTGDHRVILTWNASAPSSDPDGMAVGYCLYRSQKRKAARKNPTCNECEQINSIPMVGTTCVDDLVQDGATYYYVATAISRSGQLSSTSNESTAAIPRSKQSVASPSAATPPFCRGQASSK